MASLTERLYARTKQGRKEDEEERKVKVGIVTNKGGNTKETEKSSGSSKKDTSKTETKSGSKSSLTEKLYARTTEGRAGGNPASPGIVSSQKDNTRRRFADIYGELTAAEERVKSYQSEIDSWASQYGATSENIMDTLATKYGAQKDESGSYIFSEQSSLDEFNRLMEELTGMYDQYNTGLTSYNDLFNQANTYDRETASAELEKLKERLDEAKKEANRASSAFRTGTELGASGKEYDFLKRDYEDKQAKYNELLEQVTTLNQDIKNAEFFQNNVFYSDYLSKDGIEDYTGEVKHKQSEYMTEDERLIYNYIYAQEGAQAAQEYMDHLEESLNYREGTKRGEEIRGIESDVGRFLATGAHGVQSGLENFGRGIGQLFTEEQLATSPTQYASSYIMNDLHENGTKIPGMDKTWGELGYEGTSVVSNMLPSILVSTLLGPAGLGASAAVAGAVGSATMGLSAGGNAYTQALSEGYTEDMARTYGTMVGASEGALQYLLGGIGKLGGAGNITNKTLAKVASIENGLLRAAAAAGVKASGEIVEEELQNYLEPLYRTVIFGEEYDAPTVEDIVYTAALTFLTTGVLEGGEIASYASNKPAAYGKELKAAGPEALHGLIESGIESAADTESRALAEDIAEKVSEGKEVNDWAVGRLAQANEAAIRAEATETAPEKVVARENNEAQAANEAARMTAENVPYNVMSANERTSAAVKAVQEKTGYGEYGAKAVASIVESTGKDVETVQKAFDSAYQVGRSGMPVVRTKLETSVQQAAYDAGRRDAIMAGDIENPAQTAYNGNQRTEGLTNEEVHLRNGSQWDGSSYPGGQIPGLAESTGGNQSRKAQGKPADIGAASLSYGEKVTPSSLGIVGGSKKATVQLVVGGDTAATKAARTLAKERGLRLVLFAGDNLNIEQTVRNADGTTRKVNVSARAFVVGDRVFVRVDHPRYTSDQLMRHEAGHDMIAKGEIDPRTVRKRIDQTFGKEKTAQLADNYASAYEGSGLTAEEIWEEVICDSLGDMNIFSGTVNEKVSQTFIGETKRAASETKTEPARAPPVDEGKASWDDFPPYNFSWSDANERATRWAHKKEVKNGDRRLFSYHGAWYLVEADSKADLGYRIVVKISDRQYKSYIKELKDNGRDVQGVQGRFGRISERDRHRGRSGRGERSSASASVEQRGENLPIQRVGGEQTGGRQTGSDGDGNLQSSRAGSEGVSARDGVSAATESYFEKRAAAKRLEQLNKKMRRGGLTEAQKRERAEIKEKYHFSMETPVEETKNLIALHNMTEKNLRGVLRLGGFPMPSLAIVKADAGHTKYGPISVVFSKNTIDPKASSLNKVYGGDAYTPTDPGVYYPMDRDMERNFDRMVWESSQKFAGGEFKQSSVLGSLGYNGETRDDINEIADRLSRIDAVQAAYLSEQGKTLDPVMREKVSDVDAFGNDALQLFIDRIGQDALVDKFISHMEGSGKVNHPVELNNNEVQVIREVLKETWRNTPRFGKPYTEEQLEKRAQKVDEWRAAKFAMNAWNFYVGGGYNAEEVDHEATRDAMWDMIAPKGGREAVESVVREWAKSKLDGLLGEPGVYNGKSAFTPSGKRRSFSQRHDPYTLENIVKAMKNNQQERGGNTFGISAGSLQATATPSYKSIAEIKADSGRLGAVDSETYAAKVATVNEQIDDIISKIHSAAGGDSYGGYYRDVIGGILKEAAEGKKTVDAIVRKFKAEGYNISTQTAKEIQALYKAAAELPTEYFEAKLQRAVGFDEVLAVVVPDDLDAKLVDEMTGRGMNVLTFKAGDDTDRLAKVNSVENAKFSRELDSEGNALTEAQAEYFKDSKVRDENGNLLVMYHGTRKGGFTTFREWAYLTASKDYAKRYADNDTGETMYEVYANITKPFDTRLKKCRDLWRKEFYGSYSRTELQESGLPDWTDGYDLAEWIEENEYDFDGILLDEGADFDHNGEIKERGISYVVRSSEQIKNTTNKKPTDDPDIRFSRELDSEYMDAVESGDMVHAQRMVYEAAKKSGAIMDANGRKPLSLYRGTPNFGRTVFKSPVIFTTTSPTVSGGYGGNKGYARQRLISERYTQDDGSTETLVKNARNVLGWELKPYDDAKRKEVRESIKALSDELSQRTNDVWTNEAIDALPDVDENIDNSIAYVLSLPGDINSNIDDFGGFVSVGELESWIDKFDEHLPKLREYLNQHRNELKDTAAWSLFRLVMGYDLSDFAIDARYKLLRSFDENLLVTETGNLVTADTVREQVEAVKDVGSYHLYGFAGDNPLVIDGKGGVWHAVTVEEWGGWFTTDQIVKRAQEEGYTSVHIKNINDVAMNNYSSNVNSDIYAFFDREQVKSADPVTYDDDGNIIPLSQRFNPEVNDIRFSREIGAEGKELNEEQQTLLKDIQSGVRDTVREELERMGKEYGWIDAGEKPFREARVPRQTDDDHKVSQTVRTVLEAQVTPDADIPTIQKMIVDGEFSYDVYTDESAIEIAEHTIKRKTYGVALAEWIKDVESGKVSKTNTALGWALYNNAATAKDTETAMTILNYMVGHQRNAAQAVQATRILKKLTPDAQLYSAVKSVQTLEEDLNEGRKFNGDGAKHAAGVVGKAREDAVKAASEALDGAKVKRKGNRVTIDSNQAGEPFVFEYAQKVGEAVAKGLEAKRNQKAQERTFLQQITAQLKRFAAEKMPKEQKGKTQTAIDLLRDYVQNQAFYADAWAYAQEELREKFAGDPVFDEFINTGIGVDSNANPRNAIFMRALVMAAADSGEGKSVLRKQTALGFTGMAETIADNLIKQTGATGEMAGTIRDAAHAYVLDSLKADGTEDIKIVDAAIRSAMSDIGLKVSDVVMSGTGADAKQAIISKLVSKYGFGLTEATNTAEVVAERFDTMCRDFSQRRLESMFKERKINRKTIPEKIEQLARLGAFDVGSIYNQKAAERIFKEGVTLTVNEELASQFLQAKTQEERDNILAEIYRDIGRQMPSTFMDKWNAWRYLAMLGNPRTHVRNIVGNAGFAPVVAAKNMTAGAIESVVSFVTGGKIERTKGMVNRKLLQAAWADYDNVADEISAGGKYNDAAIKNQQIEDGRRIFKTKPLEMARKGNSAALEAEDIWFARPHYAFALAQYCKAHGVTEDQLRRGKALGNARAYAIKEAQKATYKDTNAFSDFISKLGRYHGDNKVAKGASVVVEGILPFRKTPANILVRGIEYSPVGLLKSLTYDLYKVKKGDITAAEAIDNISAGLTGTGLLAFGLWAAAEGLIRGAGAGEDEEKKYEELQGHQTYALELPDGTSITLDWLAPEVLPMFIGVNLYETATENKGESKLADMLNAVSNVTEPLLEMSCLQSLNDLFDNIGYATTGGLSALPKALVSAATSYLTQAFPTILGQFERSSQDVRMTTYTEKDSFLTTDLQYTLGKVSAKVPGWDFQQIPYIDAWGRTESTGSASENAANNFLNPAYMSQIETSAMEEELQRLYDSTGEKGVLPDRAPKYFTVDKERKDLTDEEYVEYATEKGQAAYDMLSKLTSLPEYEDMSDAEKVEAVEMVYDYTDAVAKMAVSAYKPTGWVAKAIESEKRGGMDGMDYILYETALSMVDQPNKSGELGGTPTSAEKAAAINLRQDLSDADIANLWDTKDGYALYDAGADMRTYISKVAEGDNINAEKMVGAMSAGLSDEEYYGFLDALEAHDTPTESGKYGTFTQDEAKAAIASLPDLTREQRAYLWQSVNSSWKEKNNPWR